MGKLTKKLLYDPKLVIGTIVGGSLALHVGAGVVESMREPSAEEMRARVVAFPSSSAVAEPAPDAGAAPEAPARPSSFLPFSAAQQPPSSGGNLQAFNSGKTSLKDAPEFDGGPIAEGAEPASKDGSIKPPALGDEPTLAPEDKFGGASSIESRPQAMAASLAASPAPAADAPPAPAAAAAAQAAAPAALGQAALPDGRTASLRSASVGRPSADVAPSPARRYESAGPVQRLAAPGTITMQKFEGSGNGFNLSDRAAQGESGPAAAVPQGGGGPNNGGGGGVEHRYGPHERNVLDFYVGYGKKPHPLVIFFHGGAFYRGDKSDAKDYLWFRSKGYAMASCNYRLLKHPSQFSGVALAAYDARNAVRWLRDNAETLGVDPDRFVAVGASAGGYLAAMLGSAGDAALSDGAISETSPEVQAVIDLAGPTDFGGQVIAPVQFVSANDPPTMIRHGKDDVVVSYQNSLNYAYKLQASNVRVDLKILDSVGHSINGPYKAELMKESQAFIDDVLKKD